MDIFAFYEYDIEAYDLRCHPFAPAGAPAGAVVCEVAPGQASRIHNHAETEAFLVLEGEGIVTDGVTRKPIRAGQGVVFAPFVNHIIENRAGAPPLRLISIYWMGDLATRHREQVQTGPDLRDTLIYSAASRGDQNPQHSGAILHRALDQRGVACLHVRASDDAPDANDRADRAAFRDMVIAQLMRDGHVVTRTAPAFIDATGRFLHETHVRGTCPHCGCETSAPFCETCRMPVACDTLIDPRNGRDGTPVEIAPVARRFFRLAEIAPRLDTVIKQMQMPARAYACAQAILDHGLHDIPFSYPVPAETGMQVPGYAGQAADTPTDTLADPLAERCIGHLWDIARATIAQGSLPAIPGEALSRACDPDRMLVHCYGHADIAIHTLLLPALLGALDPALAMPRQHLVTPLSDGSGASHAPGTASDPLIGQMLQRWGEDVAALLAPHGGTVPEPGAWLTDQQAWLAQLHDLAGRLDRLLTPEAFDPQIAWRNLTDFAQDSIRFCQAQRQLGTSGPARDYARTGAALAALGLKAFGILAAPLLPDHAAGIRAAFPDSRNDARDAVVFLPAGTVFRHEVIGNAERRQAANA